MAVETGDWPIRQVDVGELTLAVAEFGVGPDLVLLHGIGSRGLSWLPVIDRLARFFHLIVPDQRGHGASDKPARGYLVADYARDLEGLLTTFAIDRPTIIGHSLGGLVTIAWAAAQPGRAERLVLEDSPMWTTPDAAPRLEGWLAQARMTTEEAVAYFRGDYPTWSEAECLRRAQSITGTAAGVFEDMIGYVRAQPITDRVDEAQRITSPILLLTGDLATGGLVSPEDAERFATRVPNGQIHHIPGGSHSLHRDNTDEFLATTLRFLGVNG